jgi:hypothetical protein
MPMHTNAVIAGTLVVGAAVLGKGTDQDAVTSDAKKTTTTEWANEWIDYFSEWLGQFGKVAAKVVRTAGGELPEFDELDEAAAAAAAAAAEQDLLVDHIIEILFDPLPVESTGDWLWGSLETAARYLGETAVEIDEEVFLQNRIKDLTPKSIFNWKIMETAWNAMSSLLAPTMDQVESIHPMFAEDGPVIKGDEQTWAAFADAKGQQTVIFVQYLWGVSIELAKKMAEDSGLYVAGLDGVDTYTMLKLQMVNLLTLPKRIVGVQQIMYAFYGRWGPGYRFLPDHVAKQVQSDLEEDRTLLPRAIADGIKTARDTAEVGIETIKERGPWQFLLDPEGMIDLQPFLP